MTHLFPSISVGGFVAVKNIKEPQSSTVFNERGIETGVVAKRVKRWVDGPANLFSNKDLR
jgi:hypothetical protein